MSSFFFFLLNMMNQSTVNSSPPICNQQHLKSIHYGNGSILRVLSLQLNEHDSIRLNTRDILCVDLSYTNWCDSNTIYTGNFIVFFGKLFWGTLNWSYPMKSSEFSWESLPGWLEINKDSQQSVACQSFLTWETLDKLHDLAVKIKTGHCHTIKISKKSCRWLKREVKDHQEEFRAQVTTRAHAMLDSTNFQHLQGLITISVKKKEKSHQIYYSSNRIINSNN